MSKSNVSKQDVINSPTSTFIDFECTASVLYAFAKWRYFEKVDDLGSCADELFALASRYELQGLKVGTLMIYGLNLKTHVLS